MYAGYSSALSLLLQYKLPPCEGGAVGLGKDASFLHRNRTIAAAAYLVDRYSGQRPTLIPQHRHPTQAPLVTAARRNNIIDTQSAATSKHLPVISALPQQKILDSLFQEVTSGIQRRTEGWNIAKAVKGAVGEVRRNVNNFQTGPLSPRSSQGTIPHSISVSDSFDEAQGFKRRVQELEERNKALSSMLGDAIESLRAQKSDVASGIDIPEDNLNITLAKIQFVQVYLADSEIPIPQGGKFGQTDEEQTPNDPVATTAVDLESRQSESETLPEDSRSNTKPFRGDALRRTATALHPPHVGLGSIVAPDNEKSPEDIPALAQSSPDMPIHQRQRPRLAESSFSFMLGEDRRRSSFVSSATIPPEDRRKSGSLPSAQARQLSTEGKEAALRRISEIDADSFNMHTLSR